MIYDILLFSLLTIYGGITLHKVFYGKDFSVFWSIFFIYLLVAFMSSGFTEDSIIMKAWTEVVLSIEYIDVMGSYLIWGGVTGLLAATSNSIANFGKVPGPDYQDFPTLYEKLKEKSKEDLLEQHRNWDPVWESKYTNFMHVFEYVSIINNYHFFSSYHKAFFKEQKYETNTSITIFFIVGILSFFKVFLLILFPVSLTVLIFTLLFPKRPEAYRLSRDRAKAWSYPLIADYSRYYDHVSDFLKTSNYLTYEGMKSEFSLENLKNELRSMREEYTSLKSSPTRSERALQHPYHWIKYSEPEIGFFDELIES